MVDNIKVSSSAAHPLRLCFEGSITYASGSVVQRRTIVVKALEGFAEYRFLLHIQVPLAVQTT